MQDMYNITHVRDTVHIETFNFVLLLINIVI